MSSAVMNIHVVLIDLAKAFGVMLYERYCTKRVIPKLMSSRMWRATLRMQGPATLCVRQPTVAEISPMIGAGAADMASPECTER